MCSNTTEVGRFIAVEASCNANYRVLESFRFHRLFLCIEYGSEIHLSIRTLYMRIGPYC